jgi:hypothetical protein
LPWRASYRNRQVRRDLAAPAVPRVSVTRD